VTRSVIIGSSLTWALSLLGVVGGLIGLSYAFAESRRNPVLVRDVIAHQTLPLPVVTLCSSFLGVPSFSNYPTDRYPGQPLFTVRAIGDASGAMAVYPESLAAVEEVVIGPPEARCGEVGLPYMDAAALNRLTGVPSGGQGSGGPAGGPPSPLPSRPPGSSGPGVAIPGDDQATIDAPSPPLPTSTPGLALGQPGRTPARAAGLCASCIRLGRSPPIVLNGSAAAAGADISVRVDLVAAHILESCVVKARDFNFGHVQLLTEEISDHAVALAAFGVLDFDGANPEGETVTGQYEEPFFDKYMWLVPPGFDTDVELQALVAKSAHIDFLCNVYLFSGFFYPTAPGTDVRFRLDWRRVGEFPVWRKIGRGPYFQTESRLRTAATQARSTRPDAWLLDLLTPAGPPPHGPAPPPAMDFHGYPSWRHSLLGPIHSNFVSVFVQERPGGVGDAPPSAPDGRRGGDGDDGDDGGGGGDGGDGDAILPQPTPTREDLVERIEAGTALVRLRLKRSAGYGADGGRSRYAAVRVDRLPLAQSSALARAINSSYASWLLEFGLDSFIVEAFTPQAAFGTTLFIADVFNVVGVFTGLSLYTLLVLPGTLLLARSVRARRREMREG